MRLRAIETDQTGGEKTPPEKELEEVVASDDALSETNREKTVKNEIIAKYLHNISANLSYISKNLQEEERKQSLENKWQFAANVLDRLFFILSVLYSAILFIAVILANPNFYD